MRKLTMFTIMILILALALAACGGDDGGDSEEAAPVGDAAQGETLYNGTTIGSASAPGCVTCHSLEEGVVVVGPSHAGVASRAAGYVSGQSAEDYLRASLIDPDAHIVDGFTAGVMYQNYGSELSDQEIDNLVAYLLTLD